VGHRKPRPRDRKAAEFRRPAGEVIDRRPWWYAVGLIAASAAVFANSLSNPFVYDDHLTIVENPHIAHAWSLSHMLATTPPSPTAGRPLVAFSFAVNFALGELDPWGYHLVNLGIHLVGALLLFGIVRRTLATQTYWTAARHAADPLGFACALIWLVHPLQTEVVDYVTQRTESAMGAFYLLTLYGAMRAMQEEARRGRWTALAVVACALGMACKEPMVTAPIMVLLYDTVFRAGSIVGALRRRGGFYFGLASTWAVLAILVSYAPRAGSAGFSTDISAATYLMSQAVIVARYVGLAVWPNELVLDYGAVQPVLLRDVLPAAVLVLAGLGAVVVLWRQSRPLAFLGTWFFVTLAPSSSILPIATEVGAERRMYLPLAALVVLAVLAAFRLLKRLEAARVAPAPVAAAATLTIVCGLLGNLAMRRNAEYRSEEGIWRTVIERRPHGRAHQNLGVILRGQGRRDEALAHFRQAVRDSPEAQYSLGLELQTRGEHHEAIAAFREFLERRHDDLNAPRAYGALGQSLLATGRAEEAAAAFRETIRMWPADPGARVGLAQAAVRRERFDEAVEAYREYLRLVPNDPGAHVNLGNALTRQGRDDDAVAEFRQAVRLSPNDASMRLRLGNALVSAGDLAAAVAQYRQGLELAPDSVPLHNVLAQALAGQGRISEAIEQFERSLALDPDNPMTRRDYAELQRRIGGAEATRVRQTPSPK
jgi:tetratricopeptide (TPR) repeat protein